MSNSQQLHPPVFTSHWSKATKEQNKWWHWITDTCMSFAWSKRTSLFDLHELPWLAEIENDCIFMTCGGKEKLPEGPQKLLSSQELKNTTTPTQLLQLHPPPHLVLQRTSLWRIRYLLSKAGMYLHSVIQYLLTLQWSGLLRVCYTAEEHKKPQLQVPHTFYTKINPSALFIQETGAFFNGLPGFALYNYLFLRRGTDGGK